MFICQLEPFQGPFFFLPRSPLSAWVPESPSQAFIDRHRGLEINCCFSANETFLECLQHIRSRPTEAAICRQGLAGLVSSHAVTLVIPALVSPLPSSPSGALSKCKAFLISVLGANLLSSFRVSFFFFYKMFPVSPCLSL